MTHIRINGTAGIQPGRLRSINGRQSKVVVWVHQSGYFGRKTRLKLGRPGDNMLKYVVGRCVELTETLAAPNFRFVLVRPEFSSSGATA
jgi:hypothetical protein